MVVGGPASKMARISRTSEPIVMPMPPTHAMTWPRALPSAGRPPPKYCADVASRRMDIVAQFRSPSSAPAKNRTEAQSIGESSPVSCSARGKT